MTTTPTLAAAQDAFRSGVVALPAGTTVEDAVRNVTTAYAITYLFGLIGLILLIRAAPRILGIDLPAEAAKIAGKGGAPAPSERISVRAFRVEGEEAVGVPRKELRKQIKLLEMEIDSLRSSRDTYMNQAAELDRINKSLRNKLKKFEQ